MKTSEIINSICSHSGIPKAELAKRMGLHLSYLYRKLPNRIRANTPIAAYTAIAFPETRDRAFAVGMDGFIKTIAKKP